MPPLPPMSSEEVQNSRVPSLHGHYPASSLLRTRPPPSRRRPFSRVRRLYGLPSSADFAAGRGGLLQLLVASRSPCCRSQSRRSVPPRQPDCGSPYCLRGVLVRSASGADFPGPTRVHLRYGPVTRSPSSRWLRRWASESRSPSTLPSKLRGRLALAPA